MFYLPLTDPIPTLEALAIINAKADIAELEEQVNQAEDMQFNLNCYLGNMTVLSDIIEEWQVLDYWDENETDLLSFHQMLMMVEFKLDVKLDIHDLIKAYTFMGQLHQTLSGKLPQRPSKVSRIHDLYDSSYVPFLQSYVKHALVGDTSGAKVGSDFDSLMEESF